MKKSIYYVSILLAVSGIPTAYEIISSGNNQILTGDVLITALSALTAYVFKKI